MGKARICLALAGALMCLGPLVAEAEDSLSAKSANVALNGGPADSAIESNAFRTALFGSATTQSPVPDYTHPLHAAALSNSGEWAARLIDRGVAVDSRDAEGRTPLMVAAAFGSVDVARVLLAHGANPFAVDKAQGDSPLHFAAGAGHVEIAKLLLSHGVALDTRAVRNGGTPLHYAALFGHRKMIEFLVADGADANVADNTGVRPLQYATKRLQVLASDLLLRLGARPDDLFDAVNAGDVRRIQVLLARGVDVNTPGLDGTALHLAAATGQVYVANMLIDAGADLEAEGEPAQAHPLHSAALSGRAEVASLLIDRGAKVDARDAQGRTPLTVAASFGNLAAADALLALGADPYARDDVYRDTPIHYAVWANDIDMVKLLLARGVDVNLRSGHDGEPPLNYAAHDGNVPMIEFLVHEGADPNLRDYTGRTPIQIAAARAKAAPAVESLMRLGAVR